MREQALAQVPAAAADQCCQMATAKPPVAPELAPAVAPLPPSVLPQLRRWRLEASQRYVAKSLVKPKPKR